MIEHLRVSDLQMEYRSPSGVLEILRGSDLELSSGESVAIVGRSGAGKSTLLHLIGLLERPTKGSITLDGVDLARASRSTRDRVRRERIGFVFQFYHLLAELSAIQNVVLSGMMGQSVFSWWPRRTSERRRAEELLDRVGLGERMHHPPSKLSGGERQRVAIARALFRSPDLLLCDEPTGNLDERTSDDIEQLLLDLHAERKMGLILVTHSLKLAARLDRTQILESGKLRAVQPDDEEEPVGSR